MEDQAPLDRWHLSMHPHQCSVLLHIGLQVGEVRMTELGVTPSRIAASWTAHTEGHCQMGRCAGHKELRGVDQTQSLPEPGCNLHRHHMMVTAS